MRSPFLHLNAAIVSLYTPAASPCHAPNDFHDALFRRFFPITIPGNWRGMVPPRAFRPPECCLRYPSSSVPRRPAPRLRAGFPRVSLSLRTVTHHIALFASLFPDRPGSDERAGIYLSACWWITVDRAMSISHHSGDSPSTRRASLSWRGSTREHS